MERTALVCESALYSSDKWTGRGNGWGGWRLGAALRGKDSRLYKLYTVATITTPMRIQFQVYIVHSLYVILVCYI